MIRNCRSAQTGRYVTAKYAEKHPNTTVREFRRPASIKNSEAARIVKRCR